MSLDLDEVRPSDAIAQQIERGEISGDSMKELLDQVPNGRNMIAAAIYRALGARKWHFEKGKSDRVYEEDFRTQLDAVKLALAYQEGLPAQTTVNLNLNDPKPGEGQPSNLEAAMAASPAFAARVKAAATEKNVTPGKQVK